jgi:hypothetical protein
MVYFLVIQDSEKRILIDKMLYPLNLDESADETDNIILLFFLLAFVGWALFSCLSIHSLVLSYHPHCHT